MTYKNRFIVLYDYGYLLEIYHKEALYAIIEMGLIIGVYVINPLYNRGSLAITTLEEVRHLGVGLPIWSYRIHPLSSSSGGVGEGDQGDPPLWGVHFFPTVREGRNVAHSGGSRL